MIRRNEDYSFWRRMVLPVAVGLLILIAGSGMTFADSVVVFSGSGTSGADGRPQNGKVTFSFVDMGGGTFALTVTLENTAGPGQLGGISSILYGVGFTLSGGGTLSLNGASAPGAVDCSSGVSCVSTSPDASLTPYYGYTYAAGALLAPFPQHGIVNGNINAATDGVKNGSHQPYLVGPVTFTFLLTGGPTNGDPIVSDVYFRFGTAGETVPAGVPEPASLVLLGLGLLGLGVLGKKVR